MSKVITLLGSTGSIGTQSLDVCRMHGYEVFGLSANSSVDKLLAQIAEFHPKYVAVTDPAAFDRLSAALAGQTGAPKLLRIELLVHAADNADVGLNGSGLAIANPPWGLEDELRAVLPWLGQNLGQTQGGWKLDWLIEEKSAS